MGIWRVCYGYDDIFLCILIHYLCCIRLYYAIHVFHCSFQFMFILFVIGNYWFTETFLFIYY